MPAIRICDNPLCGRQINDKNEVVVAIHRKGQIKVKRRTGPSKQSRPRVKHTCDRCAELAFIQFLQLANPTKEPAKEGERACDNCGTRITDESEVVLDLDRRGAVKQRRKPGRKAETNSKHVCQRCAQLGYIEFLPIPQESIGEPSQLIQNEESKSNPSDAAPSAPEATRDTTPTTAVVGAVPPRLKDRLAVDVEL